MQVRNSKSKHYFLTQGNYCKFQLQNSKSKHYFLTRGNYYKFQLSNSKSKTLFSTPGNCCKFQLPKFKTIDVILMCLEILLHEHKAVIKVPGIVKQTANRK